VGHGTPSHLWLCIFSSCNREKYTTWKPVMFTGVLITRPADEGWGVPAADWAATRVSDRSRQWRNGHRRARRLCGSTQSLHAARDYFKYTAIQVQRNQGLRVPTQRAPVGRLLWSATALLAGALLLSPSPLKVSGVRPLSASLPHFYWLFRSRKFLGRHLKMVFAGWCK
jgi:hypothetical protein